MKIMNDSSPRRAGPPFMSKIFLQLIRASRPVVMPSNLNKSISNVPLRKNEVRFHPTL